jgi:hypothetical protein
LNKGMGWNSIVGMATHYELDGRDRIPVRVTIFTPVQTSRGAHPASYTMGARSFLRGKAARAWRWPPTPI